MDENNGELTNTPVEYVVSFNVLVSADSFIELRKRVTAIQGGLQKALRSNPNTDGYYISVDDIHSNIKPPTSHDYSEFNSEETSQET